MLKLIMMSRMAVRTAKIKPGQEDFMNLVKAPTGSHIPITNEEKIQINEKIDRKLQELEDTGLSREEILLSKSQRGIPLAIDPFFQFIKKNKLAREVYLKKGDRFTVEKVVDIALRQDIGPDASYSRTRNTGMINEKGRAQLMRNLQPRERGSFDPASYYGNEQTSTPTLYDQLRPKQPLRHIFSPISRYERIKTHQRKLKKYDVHWRNVELLRQFLTPHGNIKSRFVNRLSSADQKKISMAIKTARQNCSLPHYGRILGPNKRNITSLEDDVKELGLQNVNIETGEVYYSRSRSMDSIEVQMQKRNDVDNRYQQMLSGDKNFKLWIETLDQEHPEELIQAERYARTLKKRQNQAINRTKKAINLKKISLKELTGINDEQSWKVEPDQSPEAQQSFTRRKKQVKETLKKDVFAFSKILLDQKTLL